MKRTKFIVLCLVLLVAGGLAEDAERKVVRSESVEYPELARKMDLHGTVKLKIWIAPEGTVRRLEYVGGHPVLAESALACVKKWRYETAQKETTQTVEVKF
jgi:TonB family protein